MVQTAALAQSVQDVHPPYILLSGKLSRADVRSSATLNIIPGIPHVRSNLNAYEIRVTESHASHIRHSTP